MPFNSRQYEWSDITLTLGGVDITGVRGVKYTEKQEKEPVFAKGNKAHSIQRGNITYEGEISLLQSELETLTAAGNGSILGLTMTAQVNYVDITQGSGIITHELQYLEFTEASRELKQGDKFMEVPLPIIFLDLVPIQ